MFIFQLLWHFYDKKKSENVEYLTHLKNKNKNEGSGGDHYPYLIHFKKMGVINKGT